MLQNLVNEYLLYGWWDIDKWYLYGVNSFFYFSHLKNSQVSPTEKIYIEPIYSQFTCLSDNLFRSEQFFMEQARDTDRRPQTKCHNWRQDTWLRRSVTSRLAGLNGDESLSIFTKHITYLSKLRNSNWGWEEVYYGLRGVRHRAGDHGGLRRAVVWPHRQVFGGFCQGQKSTGWNKNVASGIYVQVDI